jgi:hypothetical protein
VKIGVTAMTRSSQNSCHVRPHGSRFGPYTSRFRQTGTWLALTVVENRHTHVGRRETRVADGTTTCKSGERRCVNGKRRCKSAERRPGAPIIRARDDHIHPSVASIRVSGRQIHLMAANILGGVADIQVQVAHNGPLMAVIGSGARIIRPEAGRIPPNGPCNAA